MYRKTPFLKIKKIKSSIIIDNNQTNGSHNQSETVLLEWPSSHKRLAVVLELISSLTRYVLLLHGLIDFVHLNLTSKTDKVGRLSSVKFRFMMNFNRNNFLKSVRLTSEES